MASKDLAFFRRFLILGSESAFVAGSERKIDENSISFSLATPSLQRLMLNGQGVEAVALIVTTQPLVKSPTPSLLALAVCSRSSCLNTKQAAFSAVDTLCKTPAHLFTFIQYAKTATDSKKGWGRALRRAVSNWYNKKDPMLLAELVTRYKTSAGWSHLDVLRLSHTKPDKTEMAVIFKFMLRGIEAARAVPGEAIELRPLMQYLEAVHTVKHSSDEQQVAALIRQHKLKKEHIPSKLLNFSEVWAALIEGMTISDILSNIGKIACLDLLSKDSVTLQVIVDLMQADKAIINEKVSPTALENAISIYGASKEKGDRNPTVIEELNKALKIALSKNVHGSRKRVLVAANLYTPSKTAHRLARGCALSCPFAVGGLFRVLQRSESHCQLVRFSNEVKEIKTPARMSLMDIAAGLAENYKSSVPVQLEDLLSSLFMGLNDEENSINLADLAENISGTTTTSCDMTVPITWAKNNKKEFDTIVIVTNTSNRSDVISIPEAIIQYRDALKLKTRFVICSLSENELGVSDSCDLDTLEICGFDARVPEVVSAFAAGNI